MPYDDTTVTTVKTKQAMEALFKRANCHAWRFTMLPAYHIVEFSYMAKDGLVSTYQVKLIPAFSHQDWDKALAGEYRERQKKALQTRRAAAWEQAQRQIWRVCYHWLKSKFEAIAFGLVEMREEFLPYLLMSDGQGHSATAGKIFLQRAQWDGHELADVFSGVRLLAPGAVTP